MTSKPSYNIIFAGTPQFSVAALEALINSSHKVIAVYTQPDRPSGRGRKLTLSPVKELGLQHRLPIYQPLSLKDPEEQQKLTDLNADIMIVVAYGLLLPRPVLQAPRLGCLNIHASLLPRWRGAAPIQRAIVEGDVETGVTIMQMDEGLDTGAMLYKVSHPIHMVDTSETLHAQLAPLGAKALLHTLDNLSMLTAETQQTSLVTYAHKIRKEEALANWSEPAEVIARKVRGFNPWPIVYTHAGDMLLRLWQASVVKASGIARKAGEIIAVSAEGIDVVTGQDVLRLERMQLPGGRVLSAADIVNARYPELAIGQVLS